MSFVASHGLLTFADNIADNSIFIIDLDGTLLICNSFPIWAKHCLYIFGWRAAWILFVRKILRKSHAQTKENLQKLWMQNASEQDLEKLITALKKKIRPEFAGILEGIKNGKIEAILATSAAAVYATALANSLGFQHAIASELGKPENRAEEKAKNVLELIEKQGWQTRNKIVCTDHIEDLPLMQQSDKNFWFGSKKLLDFHKNSLTNKSKLTN